MAQAVCTDLHTGNAIGGLQRKSVDLRLVPQVDFLVDFMVVSPREKLESIGGRWIFETNSRTFAFRIVALVCELDIYKINKGLGFRAPSYTICFHFYFM